LSKGIKYMFWGPAVRICCIWVTGILNKLSYTLVPFCRLG